MDTETFKVDENQNHYLNSKIIEDDLFFIFDEIPGYYKEGYYLKNKSTFTGWEEDGEIPPDEFIEKEQNVQKIEKLEDKILKIKLIKKISFVPNFSLKDTKKYFKRMKKKEETETEDNKIINDEEYNNENFLIGQDINDSNNNYTDNYNNLLSNGSFQVSERLCENIKLGEEQLKDYKIKIEKYKNSQKDIFQLLKEIRKNNSIIDNDSEEEDNKINQKINNEKLNSIEKSNIKLLTSKEQKELLMFFIPDKINSTKNTICESCNQNGHSKEQCMEYPDPNYDKSLKFCMNCGKYGHLYCRDGIEENNNESESDEYDENNIYNHGKKYYFDLYSNEHKKGISISEYEEELYETGATNIISEDENLLNYLL